MGRALQRLSTSEPDPESLEQAGAAARRYELTPLFWGVVSVLGLVLMTGILVLLGVMTAQGAKLDSLMEALSPGGQCETSRQPPFNGILVDGIYAPLSGSGTPSSFFNKDQLEENDLLFTANYFSNYRRLSELSETRTGAVCAYATKEECLVAHDKDYFNVLNNFVGIFCIHHQDSCINQMCSVPTCERAKAALERMLPDGLGTFLYNSMRPVLLTDETITQPGSILDFEIEQANGLILTPCFTCTDEQKMSITEAWVEKAKNLYPWPCSWRRLSLGEFLFSRAPFQPAVSFSP